MITYTIDDIKVFLTTICKLELKEHKTKTNVIALVENESERIPMLNDLVNKCKIFGNSVKKDDSLSSIGVVLINNKFKIAVKSKKKGSGIHYELENIRKINEDFEKIMDETGMDYVPIKIKNKIYNCVRCEKTIGTPKSDFHIIDTNGNECIWISHKAGKNVKDFQQWGGVSQRNEPLIYKHEEIQKFKDDMLIKFPDGIPNKTTVARKIKDKRLKQMAVYGNQYGSEFGRQNVTLLAQGDLSIVKSSTNYIFQSTSHIYYNPDEQFNEWEPVIALIYKGDRNDLGIRGARCVIMPLGSRKITEWV